MSSQALNKLYDGGFFQAKKLIGKSKIIKDIKEFIEKAAQVIHPVLILGETGVGKTFIAQLIHLQSTRKDKTFFHQSCSNIPETLLESELFGYEKGSFTGATERRIGKIEVANGGTLFLDEISDLSFQNQAKLLLFLERGKFFRVGGTKEIKADVRIIACSNKDLFKEMRKGRFRKDLYYRISTLELHIPSLRERKGDISLLAEYILKNENKKIRVNKRISQEALNKLMEYDFPGNIRQLQNIIKRAHTFSVEDEIKEEDIILDGEISKKGKRLKITYEQINQSLKNCKKNKTKVAKELGISRRHLYRLLEKFNMSYLKKRKSS